MSKSLPRNFGMGNYLQKQRKQKAIAEHNYETKSSRILEGFQLNVLRMPPGVFVLNCGVCLNFLLCTSNDNSLVLAEGTKHHLITNSCCHHLCFKLDSNHTTPSSDRFGSYRVGSESLHLKPFIELLLVLLSLLAYAPRAKIFRLGKWSSLLSLDVIIVFLPFIFRYICVECNWI